MPKNKSRFPNLLHNNLQDIIVDYRANLVSVLSIQPSKLFETPINLEEQAILLRLQSIGENENSSNLDFSISTVLGKNNKIKIIGAAGTGKTTLVRMIALLASKGILTNTSNLPVILRPSEQRDSYSIETDIKKKIEEISQAQLSNNILESLLTQGRVLVLIDGLDETISSMKYQSEIISFIERYPKSSLVVTSRPATDTSALDFPMFQIAPLSNNEIRQLIDIWSKNNPTIADQFWATLQNSRGLLSLASNPLLLRLMFESYKQEGRIPRSRNKLQESYVYFLLSFTSKLTSDQSKDLAEKIALFLHSNKKTTLTENEILTNATINLDAKQDDITHSLNQLTNSSILEIRGKEKYSFSHLLLQEYFCANSLKKLSKNNLLDFLVKYVGDPWWESVFSILAQDLSVTNDIANHLLQKDDPELLLLAAKFVFENPQTGEELRRKTATDLCKLLSVDKPEITLRASDFLILINEPEIEKNCLNIFETYYDKKPLASTSATYILATKGKVSTDFYELLVTSLQDVNSTVRLQACKALGALNSKQSTELLIDVLKSESNQVTLEQAISSLCRTNVTRKVTSAKLAELRFELIKLKTSGNEEIRTWAEQLDRELVGKKSYIEA